MKETNRTEIIEQIRQKYAKAATEYGIRYFDTSALEERIMAFIKSGIPVITFAQQEMEFFNRIKAMAEEKREKAAEKEKLHARLEAIMDENNEKIKQYPDSAFDPRASFEIRHMAGAIDELLPLIEFMARKHLLGLPGWEKLNSSIAGVEKFMASGPGKMSIWLKEYIETIIQSEGRDLERLDREYLQSSAVALKGLQKALIDMIDERSPHVRAEKLTADKSSPSLFASRLQGLTVEAALYKLSDWIDGILHDFRLAELADYGHTREHRHKK